MKNFIFILFFSSIFIFSCCDKNREEQLIQREQALQARADSLAIKENEYLSLLKIRDSIRAVRDSVALLAVNPWPDSISGKWISKLACIESNCGDYVIGDQRTDTWEFDSDSARLYVKVLNNKNETVRIYNADYSPDKIQLHFKTDSTASKPVVMNVELNKISKGRVKGTRIITIDDNCSAKFSVELLRPNPAK